MGTISTRFIQGSKPGPITLRRLMAEFGLPADVAVELMVFEVSYGGGKYYCCWSGGELRDGAPYLTLVGRAAMEALSNLPLGDSAILVMQELKLGPTPLRDKIRQTLERHPANSKICFLGDMQGELDGHMYEAFNVVPERVCVAH